MSSANEPGPSPPAVSFGHPVPAETFERALVVSPHFDDAALGTCDLLVTYPGSTVVTICAGPPVQYPDPPSEWDALGGFQSGDDVVAIRREEDRDAMTALAATPVWLPFVDWQYLTKEERAQPEDIAAELATVLADVRPTAVFFPMGLGNPDHVLTFRAARSLVPDDGGGDATAWFCYEDSGYKHIPGLLAQRVAQLFTSGLWPTPAVVPVHPDRTRKWDAIHCYKSQIGPLERDHGLTPRFESNVPEQYWRLAPPPPGWERLAKL